MQNNKETEKSPDLKKDQDNSINKHIKSAKNKPSQKKSSIQNSIRKIGYGLLFLLIGALAATLALYLPTQTNLKRTQAEVDRLQPIETEYLALVSEQEIVSARLSIYKTLSDTSMLYAALINDETNRIDQYIRYVEEDLKKLVIPNFPDLPSSLTRQFTKVSTSAIANKSKAMDELQNFQNDLLSAADNLK